MGRKRSRDADVTRQRSRKRPPNPKKEQQNAVGNGDSKESRQDAVAQRKHDTMRTHRETDIVPAGIAHILDQELSSLQSVPHVCTAQEIEEITDCLTKAFCDDLAYSRSGIKPDGSHDLSICNGAPPENQSDHADMPDKGDAAFDVSELALSRKLEAGSNPNDENTHLGNELSPRILPDGTIEVGNLVNAEPDPKALTRERCVESDECNIEDFVEIEEAYMDGGSASDEDRETRKRKKPTRNIEELVLDRSGLHPNPKPHLTKIKHAGEAFKRSEWWRTAEKNLPTSAQTRKQILQSYVTTIARTCVRESWNADALKASYDRAPRSLRGRAYRDVSASLSLLERARNVRECEKNWHPDLIRELLQRPEVDWDVIKADHRFDHFAGCDVCLGHRPATVRIRFKGPRYVSSDFWPGSSRLDITSTEQVQTSKISVSVRLQDGTTNDHLIRIGRNEAETEFWVDSHCLRKCVLFHELVHSTASMARKFHAKIEREVCRGKINLRLSRKIDHSDRSSLPERLERFLLRSILADKDQVQDYVSYLTDIIGMGHIYFACCDEEVLDSGKPGGLFRLPDIYDAPLDLGDELYRRSIEAMVACKQRDGSYARSSGEETKTGDRSHAEGKDVKKGNAVERGKAVKIKAVKKGKAVQKDEAVALV